MRNFKRKFKSSSIRLTAKEFNELMAAIAYYTVILDRGDPSDAALLSDYKSLTGHMYHDYCDPDNFEYFPDPDEESEI